jgi:hypothetical protein
MHAHIACSYKTVNEGKFMERTAVNGAFLTESIKMRLLASQYLPLRLPVGM